MDKEKINNSKTKAVAVIISAVLLLILLVGALGSLFVRKRPSAPGGGSSSVSSRDGMVIGFTGLTNPSGELVWTDDIAALNDSPAYNTSEGDGYVEVHGKLDSYFPFNKIHEVTDSVENVFMAFPKMYIKWVTGADGALDGIKISNVQIDEDYFIPDAFLSPIDEVGKVGETYLEETWIGKYLAHLSGTGSSNYNISSVSGESIDKWYRSFWLGYLRYPGVSDVAYVKNGYHLFDWADLTLYNFLVMLYYRVSNLNLVYKPDYTKDNGTTGSTDIIPGLNGWNITTTVVKMLGIEAPYGDKTGVIVDGVLNSDDSFQCFRDIKDYHKDTSDINLGERLPSSGYISELKAGNTKETRSFVYPSKVDAQDSESYFGSQYSYDSQYSRFITGGEYGIFGMHDYDVSKSVRCRLSRRSMDKVWLNKGTVLKIKSDYTAKMNTWAAVKFSCPVLTTTFDTNHLSDGKDHIIRTYYTICCSGSVVTFRFPYEYQGQVPSEYFSISLHIQDSLVLSSGSSTTYYGNVRETIPYTLNWNVNSLTDLTIILEEDLLSHNDYYKLTKNMDIVEV